MTAEAESPAVPSPGPSAASTPDGPTERAVGLGPPGLAALAVVLLFPLVVLRLTLRPVDDADAFWHVLSGQSVLERHAVVVQDPFGRFSTNTWVQIDWLSDVTMAKVFDLAGYPGVVWLYVVLGVALFVALYVATRQEAGVVVAGITAVLAWAGTYASQGFRPQTVSFVLLVVTLVAWRRVRAGTAGPPWWLVAVSWVWACCHGLWFLGPLVGGAVVLGLAVDRERPRADLLRLAAVPVASIVAAALTPVGPRLLTSPLTVSSYAGLVTEWRPPDVHEPYVAATVTLVALTAVGWARSGRRTPAPELLLWLMAIGWTLLYARTVAVGAIIAAPLAAAALTSLLPLPPRTRFRRPESLWVVGSAVVAVGLAGVLAPSVADRPGGVPLGLWSALDALPADTVVVNDDALGGWLLLEHPAVHPVIDTRTYLFDVPYIEGYLSARAATGDWQRFLTDTGATAALVGTDEPLVPALTDDLGWRTVAADDGYTLLVAPGVPT